MKGEGVAMLDGEGGTYIGWEWGRGTYLRWGYPKVDLAREEGYLPWMGGGVPTLRYPLSHPDLAGEGYLPWVAKWYLPWVGKWYLPWGTPCPDLARGRGVPTLDRGYLP